MNKDSSKIGFLGADGGATSIKVHEVNVGEIEKITLGTNSSEGQYQKVDGFTPVDITTQLNQSGELERLAQTGKSLSSILSEKEIDQGNLWVEAAAEAIKEVAGKIGGGRIVVAECLPGLKSGNKRGTVVVANGPRIPNYLKMLESMLRKEGIDFAIPIPGLGSDADYCGMGEQYAEGGKFRGVRNAYYAGIGTGVADAKKEHGQLVPFDESKDWIKKAWQISYDNGDTFEKIVSFDWILRRYAACLLGTQPNFVWERLDEKQRAKIESRTLELKQERKQGSDIFRMASKDEKALYVTLFVREALCDLLFKRVETFYEKEMLLDRIVIGQVMGKIWDDEAFRGVLKDHVIGADAIIGCLPYSIQLSKYNTDVNFRRHYLNTKDERLKEGIVVASPLREAPAIGAGIVAYHTWREAQI